MKQVDSIMADILVGTWLALSAILMLNIFIALLSDTFQRYILLLEAPRFSFVLLYCYTASRDRYFFVAIFEKNKRSIKRHKSSYYI